MIKTFPMVLSLVWWNMLRIGLSADHTSERIDRDNTAICSLISFYRNLFCELLLTRAFEKAVCYLWNEQSAIDALDAFEEWWDKNYSKISQSRRNNWANLGTYFKYPQEVRRLIYITNTIKDLNRQLRKVTKSKSVFPTDDSLLKMCTLPW